MVCWCWVHLVVVSGGSAGSVVAVVVSELAVPLCGGRVRTAGVWGRRAAQHGVDGCGTGYIRRSAGPPQSYWCAGEVVLLLLVTSAPLSVW